MLDRSRYLHPRVARYFPYRANRLHRMGIVKQADRHARHGRVLRPTHKYSRTAVRTEELAEYSAKVSGPIELPRLTFDRNVIVRPIGRFTEGRARTLLTG